MLCSSWEGAACPSPCTGFPHLGTGTGTSPSVSPSISLRASTFAEERGEKRECVSHSGQQGCGLGPWKCSPSFWMMHLTIFSTVSSFFSSSSEKKQRDTEGWNLGTPLTHAFQRAAASAEWLEKPRVPCDTGKPLGNSRSLILEKKGLSQQLPVQGEGLVLLLQNRGESGGMSRFQNVQRGGSLPSPGAPGCRMLKVLRAPRVNRK